MVSGSRQNIIEANRSLRNIKNDLESLLEKGMISESAFDSIQALLPTEASITTAANATPDASSASTTAKELAGLGLASTDAHPTPPSYQQSIAAPDPPTKPILAHAYALYRYAGSDARDCALERDDRIAVLEYMNPDWWMGRNLRTGQEGIFPRNYVQVEAPPPAPIGWPVDKKEDPAAFYAPPMPPPTQPPPGPSAYNSSVPPMAIAHGQPQTSQPAAREGGESGGMGSKLGKHGKKFGSKLGNAAIFGAGATIGSNIVNSIF